MSDIVTFEHSKLNTNIQHSADTAVTTENNTNQNQCREGSLGQRSLCLLHIPVTYLSVSLVVISHEGKASATARASLHREINVAHVTILLKQRKQVLGLDTIYRKWLI